MCILVCTPTVYDARMGGYNSISIVDLRGWEGP